MRVEEIKRLIALVEESQIDELEVRKWWSTVRIVKERRSNGSVVTAVSEATAPLPAPAVTAAPAAAQDPVPEPQDDLVPVKSPMVGTCYRASSPTTAPFVEVGSRIAVGQVVCIIEAMKLMNEIESDTAGVVTKILVEDQQPVEFNQPLFLIKPGD